MTSQRSSALTTRSAGGKGPKGSGDYRSSRAGFEGQSPTGFKGLGEVNCTVCKLHPMQQFENLPLESFKLTYFLEFSSQLTYTNNIILYIRTVGI